MSHVNRLLDLPARIDSRDAEVAVIGLGYVGLPLVMAFVDAGFRVLGIDVNQEKVGRLSAGISPIGDISAQAVASALETSRLCLTSDFGDLSRADCTVICVPTPLRKTKEPDVSFIVAAVEQVCRRLRSGQLVVLGSTSYPGTTHELYRPMLEASGLRVGSDFCLAFAPERIDPANRSHTLAEVPKVVGGETPLCGQVAGRLFATIFDRVVEVSNSQTAEMVKLLENTFRMINIGLANEMAMICDHLGLDVWEVIEAAATKPYGFMKFVPGPGLGGHCIPVDPRYLAWKLQSIDVPARFIELASEINQGMPAWVVHRITRLLNVDRRSVNGSKILLLGMAYKANVGDSRESPAIDVFLKLSRLGAEVRYHDPHVSEVELAGKVHKSVNLSDEAVESADLVVIMTDHDDVDYADLGKRAVRIFDARNATGPLGTQPNIERI